MRRWRSQFWLLVICAIAGCDSDDALVQDASFSPPDGMACQPCGDNCFNCGGFGCVCGERDSGGIDTNPDNLWVSPFPNTGAPGWRDSQVPLCVAPNPQHLSGDVDVWSDRRGVFALVTDGSPHTDADAGSGVELTIQHNDGSGWRLHTASTLDPSSLVGDARPRLYGVADGPLFVHQPNGGSFGACPVGKVVDQTVACTPTGDVSSLFVVDALHAYALSTPTTLVIYDGEVWRTDTRVLPAAITALWADESNVLAAGTASLHRLRLTDDAWDSETLPFSDVSSLWARAVDDVWIGTATGAVWHFDGQAWQQISTLGGVTCDSVTPIVGIWGSGAFVYFYSEHALQRWNGTSVEELANWSCSLAQIVIQDLWGNSDDEVFIALFRASGSTDTCGGSTVVYFDGTQFHRM